MSDPKPQESFTVFGITIIPKGYVAAKIDPMMITVHPSCGPSSELGVIGCKKLVANTKSVGCAHKDRKIDLIAMRKKIIRDITELFDAAIKDLDDEPDINVSLFQEGE